MADDKKKKAAQDYDPEPIDLESDFEPEIEVSFDGEAPPRISKTAERQWYVVH